MREYKMPPRDPQPQANALTDESPMPFGKYGPRPKGEGRKMKDVPAEYLLWLWDNGVHAQPNKDVHQYIKNAWGALTQDAPDYDPLYPPDIDRTQPSIKSKVPTRNQPMNINRSPVVSSNLQSVGYDADSQTLEIQFQGSKGKPGNVYQYAAFPPSEWAAFNASGSKGSFFANNIKGKYQSTKIPSHAARYSRQESPQGLPRRGNQEG